MTAAGDKQRNVALLWGESTTPTRGPKPTLSAARIARTAIDIADNEGLAAVSMQRVAAHFEYTTMSLYRYVPGKTELVALMIDLALETPPPIEEGDWRSQLKTWAYASLERYRRHPWLLGTATATPRMMGPHELSWLESALTILQDTPLTIPEKHDAFLLINGHVRNVAAEANHAAESTSWNTAIADIIDRHSTDYPAIATALASGEYTTAGDDSLAFGLTSVLDGLAARIEARQNA